MNIKIHILTVVFLLSFNFSYAEQLVSKEAQNYYDEGVKAQEGSDFFNAEVFYQKVFLLDPTNPRWWKFITNNRGVILARQGDLARAEVAFKAVLKADPEYKPAQLNLGLIYDRNKPRCESLEYWAKYFDLENLKPKDLIIEEGKEKPQTNKEAK